VSEPLETPATRDAIDQHSAAGKRPDDDPVAVVDALVARQALGAQQLPRAITLPLGNQFDEERTIGVTLEVIDEIRDLAVDVELLEDDVIDRHP